VRGGLLTGAERDRLRSEHAERTMTRNGVPLYVLADTRGDYMSIISNEHQHGSPFAGRYVLRGDQVFHPNGVEVAPEELDPRKLAESRFHAAAAARIAAREALDAAELEYGRAGRELAEAEERAKDRKISAGAAALRELNNLGKFAVDRSTITADGFRILIEDAMIRVAEAGK
jgi:hypothetical protein